MNLDVNRDGQVNVLDLVLFAVFYGTRGVGLPADVNADGIVNVQDFAALAAGVDAAGPLSPPAVEEVLMVSDVTAYDNVAAALADVRALVGGDVRLGKWLPLLEGLLQLLAELDAIPETTALLPNYPNPFNPETWIPYHLAKDTDVTVTIYNMRGVSIRELILGYQSAGVYESRGRAAYWDGRNQLGEPVASGLYFYTLTAGDFTATRKLLIAK